MDTLEFSYHFRSDPVNELGRKIRFITNVLLYKISNSLKPSDSRIYDPRIFLQTEWKKKFPDIKIDVEFGTITFKSEADLTCFILQYSGIRYDS